MEALASDSSKVRDFSSRDLCVHAVQLIAAVSAVISTRDFVATSVGGDNVSVNPTRDSVGFPVRGDNDHVIPIRDLAVPSQRDNALPATNREIMCFPVGEVEDHQMPTAHRDINRDFDSFPVCADHHNSRDLFNRDFVVSPDLAEFSVCVDPLWLPLLMFV